MDTHLRTYRASNQGCHIPFSHLSSKVFPRGQGDSIKSRSCHHARGREIPVLNMNIVRSHITIDPNRAYAGKYRYKAVVIDKSCSPD